MENEMKDMQKDILKIKKDMEILKRFLMPKADEEGELSDWAKNELEEARKEKRVNRISIEDLKKEIKYGFSN
jgi:hypothetical protein